MNTPLTVAISPCPNDTFIFGAWVSGLVPEVLGFPARFIWADVEELNRSAGQGAYAVVKVSAITALSLGSKYGILSAGAAFGRGEGPKLVVRKGFSGEPQTIAVPGLHTTAYTLLRAACGQDFTALPMVYDQVAGAVASGLADAGLLIHETALVPERYGLKVRLDLGGWWAGKTGGVPLPLGVIAASRDLAPETSERIDWTIRDSLTFARQNREAVWPLARAFARELDEETLKAHIRAYVNDMSLDMGEAGREALSRLGELAQSDVVKSHTA